MQLWPAMQCETAIMFNLHSQAGESKVKRAFFVKKNAFFGEFNLHFSENHICGDAVFCPFSGQKTAAKPRFTQKPRAFPPVFAFSALQITGRS